MSWVCLNIFMPIRCVHAGICVCVCVCVHARFRAHHMQLCIYIVLYLICGSFHLAWHGDKIPLLWNIPWKYTFCRYVSFYHMGIYTLFNHSHCWVRLNSTSFYRNHWLQGFESKNAVKGVGIGEQWKWIYLTFLIHIAKLIFRKVAPFFYVFLGPHPQHCGGSQARGLIGAVAASLHHSHSNVGSELSLQPAPQLMAMPDP